MEASNRSASHQNAGRAIPRLLSSALSTVLLIAIPGVARSQTTAQKQTTVAAFLTEVNCSAEYKPSANAAAKPLVLKPGQLRPLAAGESLRCKSGSDLTILEVDGAHTVLPDKWVMVSAGPAPNGQGYINNAATEGDPKNMVNFFSGAYTRGAVPDASIFFSPPSGETADPDHLILRWIPPAGIGNVSITVRPENGDHDLCCDGSFSGSSGMLDSSALRAALANYRNIGAREPLRLTMTDSSGRQYSVSFSLLTPRDAKKLQLDLDEWSDKDQLMRHLGRASAFSGFGLYAEAAEEYELALKDSPGSVLLVELAAGAERRTGNVVRANELEGQLKQMMAKVQ